MMYRVVEFRWRSDCNRRFSNWVKWLCRFYGHKKFTAHLNKLFRSRFLERTTIVLGYCSEQIKLCT